MTRTEEQLGNENDQDDLIKLRKKVRIKKGVFDKLSFFLLCVVVVGFVGIYRGQ